MVALREPGMQSGLGVAEVDVGDTDLGESERRGPAAQLSQHLFTVQPMVLTASKRHASILGTRSAVWAIEADCAAAARAFARHAALRDAFVELRGPLGAGKTTFVRHLLLALGVTGRVKSPSYAVVEPYELPGLNCWHFDFYRFKSPQEWEDAGFRDLFAAPGLKLAEWPEKAQGVLPMADLRLNLEPLDGDLRQVQYCAHTPRGLELLE
jgi:tRNA threonylcarbamoyladenosine biosynthesis protein TsaE